VAAPQVSVVSVTRNDLAGIQRTRASVLAQQGVKIQHIVVDGASSDGTVEWLQQQRWAKPSTFLSQPDDGIYDAMNQGAALATGSLIVFLNGGDVFPRAWTVREVAEHWQAYGWAWAYGITVLSKIDGRVSRIHQFAPFSRVRLGLGLSAVPHQATWMQTDFFRQIGGYRVAASLSADMDLCWAACQVAEPALIGEVLSVAEEGGVSAQQGPGYYARAMRANVKHHGNSVTGSRVIDGLAAWTVVLWTSIVQIIPTWWAKRAGK